MAEWLRHWPGNLVGDLRAGSIPDLVFFFFFSYFFMIMMVERKAVAQASAKRERRRTGMSAASVGASYIYLQ